MELRRDPTKKEKVGTDYTIAVNQRIFLADKTTHDEFIGDFLWHTKHYHYHFDSFSRYSLESVTGTPSLSLSKKVSFCVRDTDRINTNLLGAPKGIVYGPCGQERQGVSVGWGDTYAYNLPDQYIDVTDLPSGDYRLVIEVDPEKRFTEITRDNNVTSTLIRLDSVKRTVKVIE